MEDVAGVTGHADKGTPQQCEENFLKKAAANAETCQGKEKKLLPFFVLTKET